MEFELVGIFAAGDAAQQAMDDLRAAGFNPMLAAAGQFQDTQDHDHSHAFVIVDPQRREPDARAIMMRAGAEGFIDRSPGADAERAAIDQERRADAQPLRPGAEGERTASTSDDEHGFLHLHRHKKEEQRDQEAPSADQFDRIHESHVPWDDDAPIIREDERYAASAEDLETDPDADKSLIREINVGADTEPNLDDLIRRGANRSTV